MSSTLVKSDILVTLDANDRIFRPGYLVMEDDLLVEIGPLKNLNSRRKFDNSIDLQQRLVMPGLVNAHTHTPMTLFRGHAEGHSLFTLDGWFNTIRVLEQVMTPDMIPPAVSVSCAEMLRTGTTCFVDQYFWMNQITPPVRQSGLRAVLAYGIVELGEEEARRRELKAAEDFLSGLSNDPLITGWVGPHAFFVDNTEEAILKEMELARRFNAGFHVHFGTDGEEDHYCQKEYGCSAITRMKAMGLLDYPLLPAHCITLLPEDFHLLKDTPFTVVAAPSSGMRNASGAASLSELRKAGVNIALGTDNVTNNNSYDMFKEMALAGKLMAMLQHNAAALPTRFILEMATMGGARAIGKEKEIGSLEIGKKADWISLDLDEIGWSPVGGQDVYTALVYSVTGQHVRDVVVNGRILYRNNTWLTIDYAAARQELEIQHDSLLSRRK